MSQCQFRCLGCSFSLLLLTLPLAVLRVSAAPQPLPSLPAEAKAAISAALGRDQPAYHAKR